MEQTRSTLKTYFETGDIPSQSDFQEVFDSTQNNLEDGDTKIFLIQHDYTEINTTSFTSGVFPSATLPQGYLPIGCWYRTTSTWNGVGSLSFEFFATVSTITMNVNLTADVNVWKHASANAMVDIDDTVPITLSIIPTANIGLNNLIGGAGDFYIVCQRLPQNPTSLWP